MTAEEILDIAVDVERKAAVIYRLLYDRFKDDNMASYLFYSLSLEEEWHAKFIESEQKMLKAVPHAIGMVNVDASSLLDTLKKMEILETHIKENPITLERAISVSLHIE